MLFKTPPEVKLTVAAIKEFQEQQKYFPGGGIVFEHAIKLAKDANRTLPTVRDDKVEPDHLALMLILNVIAELIPSGHYHIYRGVLSLPGKSLSSIWRCAVNLMEERSYYTEQEAVKDRAWIRDQIKEGG